MLKSIVFVLVILAIACGAYVKILIDQRMAKIEEANQSNEYGKVYFLKAATPETKYFNIYPLKNNSILPCKYTVFNAEDRILENVKRREEGLVPEYVLARVKANVNSVSSKDYKPSPKQEGKPIKKALTALGSGFVINKKIVLTNYHLAKKATRNMIAFDVDHDLAAFEPIFNYKGRVLDAVKVFGSYELSDKNTEESIGTEVYIEGFQMHEILRLEGHLDYIDDQNLGLLFNPYKGSIYWGVASGLSGSPVVEKSTGNVIGMARSAGFYTSEDFPDEDERNTYIRIIDIDQLKAFVGKLQWDN